LNINGNIIKKLSEIQNKELQKASSEHYNNNNFLLFAISLSSKKSTVVNALIQELNLSEREIEIYISKLAKEEILSKDDEKLIKKINGKYKSKNYEQEIDEIIEHFNRVANKRVRSSKPVIQKLTSLLKTEKYEIKDFKKVNLYFTRLWSVQPNMAQYVDMNTFFRLTKFEEKLSKANDFFDELNSYKKETKKLCQEFKSMIHIEYIQRNKLISSSNGDSCEDIPLQLQTLVIHWLKQNYTIDEIIDTISGTAEQWSKKANFSQYISFSRILNEKFPDRANAVKRLKDKGKILKTGVSSVENWINKDKKEEHIIEEAVLIEHKTDEIDNWINAK